ncbi:hypothetical protein I601_3134 [Nocardioides dokdonensis FR1436]|uniref:Uncharacterized protein n=1 Tax=Nocardioides dokdonensis FR1436 TaxID=1300347 RepID=A0A1A9GPY5_9ACTN|nr:hypothetical protein I601_3134 [Nocardioides dokdonensis FR1436]
MPVRTRRERRWRGLSGDRESCRITRPSDPSSEESGQLPADRHPFHPHEQTDVRRKKSDENHLAKRASVRLNVRPGYCEHDEDAGADDRHPPRCRTGLGSIGLDLPPSADVSCHRLREAVEHAGQARPATSSAEDQVGGNEVPGGVVQFVGESAESLFCRPTRPEPCHEPCHLGRDCSGSGSQRCDQRLLKSDTDREDARERPGPFLHRFESPDPRLSWARRQQSGKADECDRDEQERHRPARHHDSDQSGDGSCGQKPLGLPR